VRLRLTPRLKPFRSAVLVLAAACATVDTEKAEQGPIDVALASNWPSPDTLYGRAVDRFLVAGHEDEGELHATLKRGWPVSDPAAEPGPIERYFAEFEIGGETFAFGLTLDRDARQVSVACFRRHAALPTDPNIPAWAACGRSPSRPIPEPDPDGRSTCLHSIDLLMSSDRTFPLEVETALSDTERPETISVRARWLWGVFVAAGHRVPFVVVHRRPVTGSFANPADLSVVFDRDQDGLFDCFPGGGERFLCSDAFNFGAGAYVVESVDASGRAIRFRPGPRPLLPTPMLRVGENVSAVAGVDLDGKPVRLGDYRGRSLLLIFWANWCGPCKQQLKLLREHRQRLARANIEVLLVSLDRSIADARRGLEEVGGEWRCVLDSPTQLRPWARRFFVELVPAHFLIDENGNVGAKRVDAEYIETLLASEKPDHGDAPH
jgi:thiol-disulfide isomerase/thioredoxin